MAAKKSVKYSKAVAELICSHVAKGMTVAQVCRKFPTKTPDFRTVYKWQNTREDFKELMNDAYQSFLMCKIDELEDISTTPLDIEAAGGDFKVASEARRVRLDTLKFVLGKLAPILTARFQTTTKVEHSGEVEHGFTIVNYAPPQNAIEGELVEPKKITKGDDND